MEENTKNPEEKFELIKTNFNKLYEGSPVLIRNSGGSS